MREQVAVRGLADVFELGLGGLRVVARPGAHAQFQAGGQRVDLEAALGGEHGELVKGVLGPGEAALEAVQVGQGQARGQLGGGRHHAASALQAGLERGAGLLEPTQVLVEVPQRQMGVAARDGIPALAGEPQGIGQPDLGLVRAVGAHSQHTEPARGAGGE
jgi:hypothetical protein